MSYRLLILAVLALPLIACSASHDQTSEDFEEYVTERNHCDDATECSSQSFGCPLGCETAYNSSYEDEIEKEAQRLISKYERGGASCDYGCFGSQTVDCIESVCTLVTETR